MPWTTGDVENHIKGLSDKAKKVWVSVANSALKSCQEKGDEDCEGSAIRQANSVAKKQMEDGCKSFYYLTDISDIQLEEKDGKKSSWIEIFRIGKWTHPKYGIIEGTKKLFNDFIDNWKNNVLGRDLAIDKTHDPSEGATGWIKEIKIVGDRLKALIEFTPWGIELIEQRGFKYFSPEYRDFYTDKESGKEYQNVLFGGGLTNRPYLTNLAPVVLSEDINLDQYAVQQQGLQDTKTQDTYLNLVEPFLSIIRSLCYSGYVDQNDLKDFVLTHLTTVDFSQVTMSEDFKKEISNLLEEYFNEVD